MKIGYKIALISMIGLLFSNIVPAQDMPLLPVDESISRGHLPNGMEYFVAENPTAGGMADFALVHRADGHVHRKSDVMVALSESVMDSTLLAFMKNVGDASPADCSIIVAGDVRKDAVVEKIKMLSYMIPVGTVTLKEPYVWKETDSLVLNTSESARGGLATLTLIWRSPRTAPELMATIQPAIASLFIGQLGLVASDRLKTRLLEENIPTSGIEYAYTDSAMSAGDETFSISVSVFPQDMERTVAVMSGVMASIDSGDVTVRELKISREKFLAGLKESSYHPLKDNSSIVDRCFRACMYGGNLVSGHQIYDFHVSRNIDDLTGMRLFNGIASAMLDKDKNVTLECVSPELADAGRIRMTFDSSWKADKEQEDVTTAKADVFVAAADPEMKMKIRQSRKEPMSGGTSLTLANGMNVIFKSMPSDGNVSYSLSLNGGYGNVKGLERGEGALFVDYLHTCRVSGMKMKDFLASLAAKGITMDFEVGISSMSVRGTAPADETSVLIQALAALTGGLEHDDEAYGYWLGSLPLELESLRGSRYSRLAEVDRIMCSDYEYSEWKSALPGHDFGTKAKDLFADRFASLEDGVLVLVGDVEENVLKKQLMAYGYRFKTSQKAHSHASARFNLVSGVSTYTVRGDVAAIDYAMSSRLPLTSENLVASDVASLVLEAAVKEEFDGSGWAVEVGKRFTVQPDERFNVMISLVQTGADGIKPMEAMSRLRAVVAAAAARPLADSRLKAYADHLKCRMAALKGDSAFWVENIAGRVLFGKDLLTGFDSRCEALTSEAVLKVISSLNEGGKVEYITIK